MPPLPITSLAASLLAVILVAISLRVSLRRIKVGAQVGDGDDETLRRRIRAQGNFIEYAPLGLIVLGLAEASSVAPAVVWTAAGLLVVGRFLHIVGMLAWKLPARVAGMIATYLSLLMSAGALLARAI